MENIHYAASLTVILGFIGAVFSYIVLKPLNNAIANLNNAVVELRREIMTAEARWHNLDLKIARIEQAVKALHERVDRMEGRKA